MTTMVRLIVFIGAALVGALHATAGQSNDTDLRSAMISMTRENHCGSVQPDPTDIRQCPTYSIAISGDGTVMYNGRSGVKTLGHRSHTVATDEFRTLVAEFMQAEFFSLRDRYESIALPNGTSQVIDHAIATTLSLSIGGRTKSVYDFYGTPDVVRRLEQRVDQVTDSRRYTGRPPDSQMEPTHE